jgi:dTDP-4-dehydrorhamnose reductase
MTTILVTGRNGQVGWELVRALMPLGRVVAWGRGDADLADAAGLRRAVAEVQPQVIVNAAAYTAVDRAEAEPGPAHAINAAAPAALAQEAARMGALLLHYSTDYVFDGSKSSAYDEGDATAPMSAYGRSKLAGELAIRQAGADHLILRTSWVYAARGGNFLRTILRLAAERDELRVIADQIGAPTWARFIAEATAHIVARALAERRDGAFSSGVYHLTAGGQTSWHGFAEELLREAACLPQVPGLRARHVHAIATEEYPLPAPRPRNSRLATARLRQRFGLHVPPWQEGVRLCLEELFPAPPPPPGAKS